MARVVGLLALVLVLGGLRDAAAEVYRFVAADGTVHFTNTPTDTRFSKSSAAPAEVAIVRAAPAPPLPPPAAEETFGQRLGRYARIVRDAADRYGVPERLINAVIRVESGFNPRAVSRKGAQGLMQLMPATASMLGVRNAFDPEENVEGGVRHLRGLIERFSNDVPLALAAYNAGEQAVVNYRGIPPFPETRDYVTRVLQFVGRDGREPEAAQPDQPQVPVTYRRVEADGTVVYTNIPARPRL